MFSQKAKYAIKALTYLAKGYGQGPILISELSSQEHIPKKFLESILLELRNDGFLRSKKGKGGGYYLGVPPDRITLGQVIRCLNGPIAPISCASVSAYEECESCENEMECGLRLVMMKVRDSMAGILDNTSLNDLVALEAGASGNKRRREKWDKNIQHFV